MEDKRSKTKFVILTVAFVVLLAVAIALIVMMNKYSEPKSENTKPDDDVKASIRAVCENTDYQKTCVDSLSKANTQSTDPFDLVKTMFEVTIQQIDNATKNSPLMKEIHEDPRTNDALKSCKELAGLAISDLTRSFDNINIFNLNDFGQALVQLKIWMSGAITYEQTCLDGFEKTEGDCGENMKQLLNQSMELTSNCLALITDFSQAFQSIGAPPGANNRRLLSIFNNDYNLPDWVDANHRSMIEKAPMKIKPDVTIAQDGSGNFISINEALKFAPVEAKKTYVIYIKEGVYNEIVLIPKNLTHITIIGDGPEKTRITGRLNFIDGVSTYHTATVAVSGDFFMARDIGFENTAGPEKHQAVALRVSADRTIFYNCRMDGYQDTLYAHTYRQFYRECTISGTIDFVFGDGAAVFQNCIMVVRKPMDNQNCIVTAQGRKEIRQPTGLVLQNCSIIADPIYFPMRMTLKSYLGRPWKQFSRTIIMESFIDDLIQPQGWLPWNESFAFDTLFYSEFNNHGPGSSKLQRVQWPGVKELSARRIKRFTPGKFIIGDTWIPPTGVPYTSEFMFEPPKDDDSKNDNNDDDGNSDGDSDSDDKKSKEKDKDKKSKEKEKEKEKKEKEKKDKEKDKDDSKEKKKPKKDKDNDKDKPTAPAESPNKNIVPKPTPESPNNNIVPKPIPESPNNNILPKPMPHSDISAPPSNQTPAPEASPKAKRKSFFKRFFGSFSKS